jgi:hypothetical protein
MDERKQQSEVEGTPTAGFVTNTGVLTNWARQGTAGTTYTFVSPATLSPSTRNPRQIFVAYPFKVYPKADYRPVFTEVGKAFDVKFVFADEKITTLHILEKVRDLIRSSRFGIYDISDWNANVTLELGLAFGMAERAYIACDPSKTDTEEVPADLRGLDRIQYASYAELSEGVTKLLSQEFPIEPEPGVEDQLGKLRGQTLALVGDSEGLKIGDIARALGVSTDYARLIVKPLLSSGEMRTEGQKRGTKYFLAG